MAMDVFQFVLHDFTALLTTANLLCPIQPPCCKALPCIARFCNPANFRTAGLKISTSPRAQHSSWMFWLFLHAVTHTGSSHVKALPLWISMDAVHKSFFNAMIMPSFLRQCGIAFSFGTFKAFHHTLVTREVMWRHQNDKVSKSKNINMPKESRCSFLMFPVDFPDCSAWQVWTMLFQFGMFSQGIHGVCPCWRVDIRSNSQQ